jgi:hypothetical protein
MMVRGVSLFFSVANVPNLGAWKVGPKRFVVFVSLYQQQIQTKRGAP